MKILFIVLPIIFGIGFLVKRIFKYKDFGIRYNKENGFRFLLGWIVFGFLTRFDYTTRWGCIIEREPILEPKNILFSIISFGLIFWGFKTNNEKTRKNICVTEWIYWFLKLVILKGGYIVGIGASPDVLVVFMI